MKKQLALALFAVLTAIAGANPAGAAVPADCHLYNTNGSGWPFTSAYYCGNLDPKHNTTDDGYVRKMFTTLFDYGTSGWFGTKNATQGGNFLLYRTTKAANADLSAQQQLTGFANGVTYLTDNPDKTRGTTIIVITPASTFALPVNNVTAHELGHYLDKFGASAGGATGSQTLSDTAIVTSELGLDATAINQLTACTGGNPKGVFDGQTDFEDIAICDGAMLSSTYAGAANNFQVITAAWPIYSSSKTHLRGEYFAEQFAIKTGNYYQFGGYLARQDYYFNDSSRFQCQGQVISSLLSSPTNPPKAKLNVTSAGGCKPYVTK